MYRALAFITALILLLCAGSMVWGEEQQTGIIVTGSADVQGQPDVAYVTLGVNTQDKIAATAAQANAAATDKVITAIIHVGIPKTDIRTSSYSIGTMTDYRSNPPVITGYQASNEVQVTIHDLAKIGPVIDAAVAAGANVANGVNFGIENDTELRQRALVLAIKSAQAKAQTMAEVLGVKLGPVLSATEAGGVTPPRPVMYGMAKAEAAPTPIMPGQLTVNASVTVVYIIIR